MHKLSFRTSKIYFKARWLQYIVSPLLRARWKIDVDTQEHFVQKIVFRTRISSWFFFGIGKDERENGNKMNTLLSHRLTWNRLFFSFRLNKYIEAFNVTILIKTQDETHTNRWINSSISLFSAFSQSNNRRSEYCLLRLFLLSKHSGSMLCIITYSYIDEKNWCRGVCNNTHVQPNT